MLPTCRLQPASYRLCEDWRLSRVRPRQAQRTPERRQQLHHRPQNPQPPHHSRVLCLFLWETSARVPPFCLVEAAGRGIGRLSKPNVTRQLVASSSRRRWLSVSEPGNRLVGSRDGSAPRFPEEPDGRACPSLRTIRTCRSRRRWQVESSALREEQVAVPCRRDRSTNRLSARLAPV